MTASDIYLETMRACLAELLGTPKGDERGQTLLPTKASKDRPCEVNSMNTKPMIPADQYFRELEAWAKSKERKRPTPERKGDGKAVVVRARRSRAKQRQQIAQQREPKQPVSADAL